MLWISYDKNIPSNFRRIGIRLSFDEFGQIKVETVKNEKPDPSTIWVHLPIQKGEAEKLSYWPHYIDLSPQQRYAYLSWLRNVDVPTDMGYVFLYYYGLEKHLILGDIEKAVNQI
ncbi:MAG: TerB N-terminal domain-containing protein [Dysgonamonadaceae bacterium]|nr:TerB N-terminal domain-containing protein [Dysgonamonadaceae bacterium]MDD4400258.1 TerB N-terminal domain-containing protein [Dysgonamonadaceae bacterium]